MLSLFLKLLNNPRPRKTNLYEKKHLLTILSLFLKLLNNPRPRKKNLYEKRRLLTRTESISQTSQESSEEKSSTQVSLPERTQPSFYENAIIESKDKIYIGRTSVIPTTALSINTQKKPDSEKPSPPPESPITEEIRIAESVNPIETVVGKPNTLSCADLNNDTESQVLCIECLSNHTEQKAISRFSSSFENKFIANNVCINEGAYLMNQVKKNFNNNCHPFHFQEYVTELACQSCQAQIPPAIMFVCDDYGKHWSMYDHRR